eukprot:gnl/Trimastix_PCT/4736.p2 GENE.gnl/Trimastix_PCT/4736~~gnl/Trimastix_PCT/4736.p2  ORF type:complete len:105 (-),score=10.10 gnl/Trimastix_PCT/4736:1-315(-)
MTTIRISTRTHPHPHIQHLHPHLHPHTPLEPACSFHTETEPEESDGPSYRQVPNLRSFQGSKEQANPFQENGDSLRMCEAEQHGSKAEDPCGGAPEGCVGVGVG